MSADFWAGYISGAAGIVIGNPLDILKVHSQVSNTTPSNPLPEFASTSTSTTPRLKLLTLAKSWTTGSTAPIIGYGALNAILFVSRNRAETALNKVLHNTPFTQLPASVSHHDTVFLAGCIGGLATWVVSTPTELIKCRSQLALPTPNSSSLSPASSSLQLATQILRTNGIRGLYFGGTVTALRDSIGYGVYFWTYEVMTSRWPGGDIRCRQATTTLLCGGLAGVASWVSIFPLDVVKTRVQAQVLGSTAQDVGATERAPLLVRSPDNISDPLARNTANKTTASSASTRPLPPDKRLGAWQIVKAMYREENIRPFFRGLTVCSVRAFIVNAVQWTVYEWLMLELGHRSQRDG